MYWAHPVTLCAGQKALKEGSVGPAWTKHTERPSECDVKVQEKLCEGEHDDVGLRNVTFKVFVE